MRETTLPKSIIHFMCLAIFLHALGYSSLIHADNKASSLDKYRPTLDSSFIQALEKTDPAKGEIIFMRKCSSCHDHKKEGGNGKGPHLWNWSNRQAGTYPGFEYSEAMRKSGHVWTIATLNYYLTDTEKAVPGRSMDFRGIRRDKARINLLAFLRTLNDEPPIIK